MPAFKETGPLCAQHSASSSDGLRASGKPLVPRHPPGGQDHDTHCLFLSDWHILGPPRRAQLERLNHARDDAGRDPAGLSPLVTHGSPPSLCRLGFVPRHFWWVEANTRAESCHAGSTKAGDLQDGVEDLLMEENPVWAISTGRPCSSITAYIRAT